MYWSRLFNDLDQYISRHFLIFYVWQTNPVYAVASATGFGRAGIPCATCPIIPARQMGGVSVRTN